MNKPKGYWTKEKCLESALKYYTRNEWKKDFGSAYVAARHNGWLDECTKHMYKLKISLSKEMCFIDAKKYQSRSEWKRKSKKIYEAAVRNKWLNYCCNHMSKKLKYCVSDCVKSASKYNTVLDWRNNEIKFYDYALKYGWLKFCITHMSPNKYGFWNKENCIKEASKFKTKLEWIKNSNSSYSIAHRNGWLNECCGHMIIIGSHYKRLIYAFEFSDKSVYVGLTYNPVERKTSHLITPSSQVYKHIKKSGLNPEFKILTNYLDKNIASKREGKILEEYISNGWIALNKNKTGGLGGDKLFYDKNRLIEIVKKSNSWREFYLKNKSAYSIASKHNLLPELKQRYSRIN
jgi:hypothetical protein